ncbi:hypothetical protein ACP4OV_030445 [Aristida adscensionis]
MAASPAHSSSSSSSSSSTELLIASPPHGDTAGGSPRPAAEGVRSTLTSQETLLALCRRYGVPADHAPACAGAGGRACRAPRGAVCVYEDALAAGMRVPLHPFYAKLLRHYGLAPAQLTPSAWRHAAAFVVLCSDAGLPKPRLAVFRRLFAACAHRSRRGEGWYFFKPRRASEHGRRGRLFAAAAAAGWALPKNDGWKERFFFLASPTGAWPCPVAWGKPGEEAAGDPKLSDKAQGDLKKLYDLLGSAKIDLGSLLAEHKLAAAVATPVKIEENDGAAPARKGAMPKGKAPAAAPSPPMEPGGGICRDQLLASLGQEDGEDWLQTVLKKTAEVVQKESSLLRQKLGEAGMSEMAARAELAEAKKSEAATKAELDKARKSEAAAKAELATAKAELGVARQSEAAAKAELATANAELGVATKSEAAAKAKLFASKAELCEARKSEEAAKAELIAIKEELASAKAKVQKTGNEHLGEFVRLHSLMMDNLGNAFGTVVNKTLLSQAPATQDQDNTR